MKYEVYTILVIDMYLTPCVCTISIYTLMIITSHRLCPHLRHYLYVPTRRYNWYVLTWRYYWNVLKWRLGSLIMRTIDVFWFDLQIYRRMFAFNSSCIFSVDNLNLTNKSVFWTDWVSSYHSTITVIFISVSPAMIFHYLNRKSSWI